ncbi:hypothetical protein lerEdw1_007839 [Lerista edwardsae]|nr:hypothetical protein lerEdw1_007839 [Lerista edwardsae]
MYHQLKFAVTFQSGTSLPVKLEEQTMLKCCLVVFILGLTVNGKQMLAVGWSAQQISKHSTFEIIIPQRLTEREKRWTHFHEEHSDNQLSYLIQTGSGTHILKLKKNKNLIGANFNIYTYNKDGKLEVSPFEAKAHCYYHGVVEGDPDSLLALSTCDGIRGILNIDGKQYGMEPVNGSAQFEHFFYALGSSYEKPVFCGVPNDHLYHEQSMETVVRYTNISYSPFSKDTILRRKRAVLPEERYVELYVVVDKDRYLQKKSDIAVQKEMVELANYVDGMFSPLNIQVVLVGLEIWMNQNLIDVNTGSAGDVLGRFVNWREKDLMKRSKNDVSHLIIGRPPFGGTVGMAFVGTVCNPATGGSISTINRNSVISHATIVAHELGHNLGMNHDDGRCSGSYIMHSTDTLVAIGQRTRSFMEIHLTNKVNLVLSSGSKNFSTCSSSDFEHLILRGGGACLRNAPKPSDVYTEPVCGNNIVDTNEECDCGTPKFKVAGVECRSKMNTCDLPEYCNGTYPYCPEDVYIMNGHPCNNMKEYCYSGVCQNYDAQCETLFGKGTFLRSDVPDPALVQKGTACDKGKACVDYKCVDASQLGYSGDVKTKCHDRAVLNNKGNCHCDPGWAPPFCDSAGYGGSIDSGPTHIGKNHKSFILPDIVNALLLTNIAIIALPTYHQCTVSFIHLHQDHLCDPQSHQDLWFQMRPEEFSKMD